MAVKTVGIGDSAPDFKLKSHTGEEFALNGLRGKKVVLSFHPLAWTEVCKLQMQDLEAHFEEFAGSDGVVVGFSVDAPPSKRAWAEAIGVERVPLLSDFWPHGAVAQEYGVFNEDMGASGRVVFIVDADGIIRWKKVYPIPERPDIDEIIAAFREL